jgi:hypothetical protein
VRQQRGLRWATDQTSDVSECCDRLVTKYINDIVPTIFSVVEVSPLTVINTEMASYARNRF